MKILLLTLVAAAALFGGGCRSTPPPSLRVEHRTAEMEAGSMAEQVEQVRRAMDQWQRDGWSVLSTSAPSPLANGNIRRTAELERKVSP